MDPVVFAFPQPLNQSFPELTHYHRNGVLVERETLTYYLQTLAMSRQPKNCSCGDGAPPCSVSSRAYSCRALGDGHKLHRLRKNSVLHLILGGAAVHRCGKCIVLNPALAAAGMLRWDNTFSAACRKPLAWIANHRE